MASELEIVNRAVTRLGDRVLTSLDEGTLSAQTASIALSTILAELHSSHDWSFSKKTAKLVATGESNIFGAEYALPSDMIELSSVVVNSSSSTNNFNVSGNKLYSTAPVTDLIYTTGDIQYSSLAFQNALYKGLVYFLSTPFTGDKNQTSVYKAEYDEAITNAVLEDQTKSYNIQANQLRYANEESILDVRHITGAFIGSGGFIDGDDI